MQKSEMRLLRPFHGALEYVQRLGGVGALRRLPAVEIPELPRRAADQRLCEQRRDVLVVTEPGVHLAHRDRVGVAPRCAVLRRGALREPRRERCDQRLLHRRGRARKITGTGDRRVCAADRVDQLLRLEGVPVLVVVRSDRVRLAPVRHRAVGVSLCRTSEAAQRLLVVEGVTPDQPAIEPGLRSGRTGLHREGVGAQVVAVVSHNPDDSHIRPARMPAEAGPTRAAEGPAHDRGRSLASGRRDSNSGPHRPERCALPGCATPRRQARIIAQARRGEPPASRRAQYASKAIRFRSQRPCASTSMSYSSRSSSNVSTASSRLASMRARRPPRAAPLKEPRLTRRVAGEGT